MVLDGERLFKFGLRNLNCTGDNDLIFDSDS